MCQIHLFRTLAQQLKKNDKKSNENEKKDIHNIQKSLKICGVKVKRYLTMYRNPYQTIYQNPKNRLSKQI